MKIAGIHAFNKLPCIWRSCKAIWARLVHLFFLIAVEERYSDVCENGPVALPCALTLSRNIRFVFSAFIFLAQFDTPELILLRLVCHLLFDPVVSISSCDYQFTRNSSMTDKIIEREPHLLCLDDNCPEMSRPSKGEESPFWSIPLFWIRSGAAPSL